jgi:enamine deaminase RidA (YjgF/YER057c/UK114 family)
MSQILEKLSALNLRLPAPMRPPPGVRFPFTPVRVRGPRVLVAGHGPLDDQGALAPPLGRVGAEVTVEQAYQAARQVALTMLASLERSLGADALDRLVWLKVLGMVRSAPGFAAQPQVVNGFSDLILEVFGPERGAHARSAVGMAELPFGIPVEVEAELELEA